MNCKICNDLSEFIFENTILKKYKIKYYLCSKCGFLQTENPFWLKEAYRESISIYDTGIFQRNNDLLRKILILITRSAKSYPGLIERLYPGVVRWIPFKGKFLDYGGGYGILVRMLRDIGVEAFWTDKFSTNLFSKGFEVNNNDSYPIIGCFELFEHFENPKDEFEKITKKFNPEMIIISTNLYGSTVPNLDWWYYVFDSGQHISFYTKEALEILGKIFDYNFYSFDEEFHLFYKNDFDPKSFIDRLSKRNNRFLQSIKNSYNSLTIPDHEFLKNISN
jgi:hypothetical protein